MTSESRGDISPKRCTICEVSLDGRQACWDFNKPYCSGCIEEGKRINRLTHRPKIPEDTIFNKCSQSGKAIWLPFEALEALLNFFPFFR